MSENTFLWQLIYRIPATNKWRLPGKPASDPETWCSRCQLNFPKDLFHCIWACPISHQCWSWCAKLLSWISTAPPGGLHITPTHVLIVEALPMEWETPEQFWHTIRAILSWIIRKAHNQHVFEGKRSDAMKIIRLTWHRLGIYIRVSWKELIGKVRLGRLTLTEACDLMALKYGAIRKLWTLDDVQIRIPPVPPRPP